ncbi:hypothetical protein [Streptomonospora litoralis]|uniref:Gram-positive cocci surface proteins LPxTG domain-containing protein n=1 Tax=Streptomonospora litoralis TaxID=2498135 RepID=A0A4P6Q3B4_9ACTN|nr:hypothetical protein [Streptomonospora litoralis]QBI55168.1 hypothetical protein EKD16_16995 [Streptomonospora litoralis]
MQFLVRAGLAASALALTTAPAAAATSIEITPATAAPGDSITLRSSCEGPAEQVEFTSRAFSGVPSAELVNTFGSVPVVVAPGTSPGVYRVHGACTGGGSAETVSGEVTVVRGPLTPTPRGAPQTGGGGAASGDRPALLAALAGAGLLMLGTAAAAYRRRARRGAS